MHTELSSLESVLMSSPPTMLQFAVMEGRSLSELKVADLRRELEKRQKDKVGVKQVLVDRLKEALEEDGHDPLTYRFGNEMETQSFESEAVDQSVRCSVALCDVSSVGVNGDSMDSSHTKDEAALNRHEPLQSDSTIEEPAEQKKMEEPVTYVVQVGDQEDLDYDLKSENDVAVECNNSTQDQTKSSTEVVPKVDECAQSGKVVKPGLNKSFEDTQAKPIESQKNLWVSNLPKSVKAADLKQHFSKSGKVVSATVVMSTRSPGGCFGFLQMASAEDAAKAARHFDCSDYNGCKISVEATERKPPALTSKVNDRPIPRAKHSNSTAKAEPSRSRRWAQSRRAPRQSFRARQWLARARAAAARTLRSRNIAARKPVSESRRETRISRPPPRMNRRIMAYQSLRRASLMLATTRYGSGRPAHNLRESVPSRYADTLRSPPSYSRQSGDFDRTHRYSSDRHEAHPATPTRRPETRMFHPDRRQLVNPVYDHERSRPLPPPPLPRAPMPRKSEPLRDVPRLREPLPPPPPDRRRSLPSTRLLDTRPRVSRLARSPADLPRSYSRPAVAHRPDEQAYDRMDSGRGPCNRQPSPLSPPINRMPEHYRSYESVVERRPSPARGYPSRPVPTPRREYRDISRSPPRSRNMALMRPYPDVSPHHDMRNSRPIRDRSPPTYGISSDPRPKVVDYGHRSEPRNDYPGWRGSSPRIHTPGHTWKPAGHSFVSNYGARRY